MGIVYVWKWSFGIWIIWGYLKCEDYSFISFSLTSFFVIGIIIFRKVEDTIIKMRKRDLKIIFLNLAVLFYCYGVHWTVSTNISSNYQKILKNPTWSQNTLHFQFPQSNSHFNFQDSPRKRAKLNIFILTKDIGNGTQMMHFFPTFLYFSFEYLYIECLLSQEALKMCNKSRCNNSHHST
jgi:hypothetical protein